MLLNTTLRDSTRMNDTQARSRMQGLRMTSSNEKDRSLFLGSLSLPFAPETTVNQKIHKMKIVTSLDRSGALWKLTPSPIFLGDPREGN